MQRDDIIRVLKRFKRLNADRYNIVKLGLFGSGARDKCGEESDIDVVVVLSKPDMFNLVGIKQDLEKKFQCHVDIVRYRDRMNPFLKRRIEKEAVYV
jgi:predicted nucleotidyltransferase